MSDSEKSELIKNDPVAYARYFHHKVTKLMIFLKKENSLFEEYQVVDSFEKVEFQSRGSSHEHIFLWTKKPPPIHVSNTSNTYLIAFIDRFVTCKNDMTIPFIRYLKHRHTHSCYRKKRKSKKCRFNFPLLVMPSTVILEPLPKEECDRSTHLNIKNIRDLHNEFFESEQFVSFKDILTKLNITEEEYILAIRSALKRPQIFLKRKSTEVAINSYNPVILALFESNIDLQIIFDEYGVANYVVNYMCKMEAGMSAPT